MPYCHNCGHELPEGAKFCPECASAVITPSAAANGGEKHASAAKDGGKTALIAALAAAGVLVAALLVILILVLSGTDRSAGGEEPIAAQTQETAQQTPEETPEETQEQTPEETQEQTPEYTEQGVAVADIRAIMETYRDMTQEVIDATQDADAAGRNRGNVYDYDADGYPELTMLYCLDGLELHALVARRGEDGEACILDRSLCWLVGGAQAQICVGTLDSGETVVHLVDINWEAESQVGKDWVYALTDGDIVLRYKLEWIAEANGDLVQCYVFDENDQLISRDDAGHFLSIYGCMDYCEVDYPDGSCGVLLAELFSDEAMQAYFQS